MRSSTKMGLVCLAVLLFSARRSEACGGFFCNNVPVDQAGERILFVMDEGHVTAHIQIQYQGEADAFSWVVPTTVIPEIGVGTDEIFGLLAQVSAPYISRTYSERNGCDAYRRWYGPKFADSDSPPASDAGVNEEGGVRVIQSSTVGPFETVTLDSDDPEALLVWLRENEYTIPPAAEPIVAAYVAANSYFVGFKLTKGADTGDLQPIVLELDTHEACVPLRLTAIAAVPDMPVTVYFLGNGRAVSTNFPDVELNDVLLHHPAGLGYPALASAAIDAVGGRAFVTDFAGASWPLLQAIAVKNYDTAALHGITDPVVMMEILQSQGYMASQMLLGILLEYMPPPAAATEDPQGFYNCPSCYDLAGYTFDAAGLADALQTRIVAPLREIESDVGRHTHLTRLFTTISPAEMTEDPFFEINRSAPLVTRELHAHVIQDCRDTQAYEDDFQEIVTANGHRFCAGVSGSEAPVMPFYERVTQWSATGAGVVRDDQGSAIDAAISCDPSSLPARGTCRGGDCNPGGLCAAAPGAPASDVGFLLATVLGLALTGLSLRRRR